MLANHIIISLPAGCPPNVVTSHWSIETYFLCLPSKGVKVELESNELLLPVQSPTGSETQRLDCLDLIGIHDKRKAAANDLKMILESIMNPDQPALHTRWCWENGRILRHTHTNWSRECLPRWNGSQPDESSTSFQTRATANPDVRVSSHEWIVQSAAAARTVTRIWQIG